MWGDTLLHYVFAFTQCKFWFDVQSHPFTSTAGDTQELSLFQMVWFDVQLHPHTFTD
jgi:hypothetical protein